MKANASVHGEVLWSWAESGALTPWQQLTPTGKTRQRSVGTIAVVFAHCTGCDTMWTALPSQLRLLAAAFAEKEGAFNFMETAGDNPVVV